MSRRASGPTSLPALALALASTSAMATGCSADDPCDGACGPGAYCDATSRTCFCRPGHHGDPLAQCSPHEDLCAEAVERTGHGVCVHALPDAAAWNAVSIPSTTRADLRRVGKYMAPASPEAPLPTLFSDTNHYRLHFCMLQEAFAPMFPGFTHPDYNDLVYWRDRRSMVAGSIFELVGDDLPARYGFVVQTDDTPYELLTQHEVYAAYRTLNDRFGAGELAYLPYTDAMVERAASWGDVPFTIVIAGDEAVNFEPYTTGATYGRIRRYSEPEIPTASGTFGWQDIVVLETSSAVLQGVNAGVITGRRQDVLSHLNVLAAQRGTPNAFVVNPLEAFEAFEGELVRLDVTDTTYIVAPASLPEAEAFWAEHRPHAELERPPDADYTELPGLLELPTASEQERLTAVSRVGGKATGLATLYTHLDPAYQAQGFAIPVAWYFDFMDRNAWDAEVDGQLQTLTYAQTLDAWRSDPAFATDTDVRRDRLAALTAHMIEHGAVDPQLLPAVRTRIEEIFGDESTMVRLRSSSNAEDGVDFNGAGLYDSTRACALDEVDEGPSQCDAGSGARSLPSALRRVWASAWSFGAYEEREYYQLDQAQIAMGVLVSTRFVDEQANGVVFTGNPLDPSDRRFTVNVQKGEVDVVEAGLGIVAELDRLTVEGGQVQDIERVTASSLVPEGTYVLDEAQLGELGQVVAAVAAAHPVDVGAHDPSDVLLDLEFKIDAQGRLVFKQIRPFLRSAVDPNIENCSLLGRE